MTSQKHIAILGTRGIPAEHGGFETFAENFALYLVKQGWAVTVYCQKEGKQSTREYEWQGVNLVDIFVAGDSPLHTIIFDYRCIRHSLGLEAFILNLGYNTGFLNLFYRFSKHNITINMDGLEWKRSKWPLPAKAWFYINEWLGCWLGQSLIADHPEIARHLYTRIRKDKVTTIAYGADRFTREDFDATDMTLLNDLDIEPDSYLVVIARPESENSILEIAQAFSQNPRRTKLLFLGKFDFSGNEYHRKIQAAASDEVLFPGAIYDKRKVAALRCFAIGYIHGHQVGGTNPSLVEALGAGAPVIAHDNDFNRWVTGNKMLYFSTVNECSDQIQRLIDDKRLRNKLSEESRKRFNAEFTWNKINQEYLAHFERMLARNQESV